MTGTDSQSDAAAFISSLVRRDMLDEGSAQRVLAARSATGHALDTVVTELGLLREDIFAKEVASFLGADHVDDLLSLSDQEQIQVLGSEFLATHAILPLKCQQDAELSVAVADPFDATALSMIEYQSERALKLQIAARSAIGATLTALKHLSQGEKDISPDGALGPNEGDLERLRDFAQQAPVVRLVSKVAQIAFDDGATDIHFEPFELSLRIRIRVDGDLKTVETVSADLLPGIATRLKILSNLDIAERRLPQDGRMRLVVRGQDIDMRVSIVPTIHGETIVLRVLDRSAVALDLPALGFEQHACSRLAKLANNPNGIFLITGPTGSGKTTTLYALISLLNRANVKIFTVEDPVEYRMSGITQVQTNSATGLTFARALRSVLRQDPDIILVGEIRDRETAEIAMQAALTGHLVFSTLHTNSAVGAVTRLRDMGIENYLIGATVNCIIGQRLMRKSCSCVANGDTAGCDHCGGTGYKGRTVTYEIAEISAEIAAAISSGASEMTLQEKLSSGDFVRLDTHAMSLAKAGITTVAEVARTVRLAGDEDQ